MAWLIGTLIATALMAVSVHVPFIRMFGDTVVASIEHAALAVRTELQRGAAPGSGNPPIAQTAAIAEVLIPAFPSASKAVQQDAASTTAQAAIATSPTIVAEEIVDRPIADTATASRVNSLIPIVAGLAGLFPRLQTEVQNSYSADASPPLGGGAPNTIAAGTGLGSLAAFTTSNLAEGSNLYFTNARVAAYINSSSTIPTAVGGAVGDVLTWNGSNWTPAATSSLGIAGGSAQWAINGSAISYSAGNVGLGTSSPSALLTLASPNATGTIFRVANTSSGGHVFDLLSTGSSNTSGAGRLDIFDSTAGLARLSIAANGSVGIGTTSPSQALSVSGNGLFSGSLSVLSAGASTSPSLTIGVSTSGLYYPAADTLGFAENCESTAAGNCNFPIVIDTTGRMIFGAGSVVNSNHSNIEIDEPGNGNNGVNPVVPIQMNQWVPGVFAIQPFISWRSDANAPGTPGIVQTGDALGLWQSSGDDGLLPSGHHANATAVNVGTLVDSLSACGGVQAATTTTAGIIPGELYVGTENPANGAPPSGMTTAFKVRCNGDIDIPYGNLTQGNLRHITIDPNYNGYFNNITLTGSLNLALPLATPSSGDGEVGGYNPLETASNNLLLQSNAFGTSPWTLTSASVSAATTTSPDGTADAVTLTSSATGGKTLQQGMTISADSVTAYTESVYFNSASPSGTWTIRETFVGGSTYSFIYTVGTGGQSCTGGATCKILELSNGWYRLSLTATNAGQTQLRMEIWANGTAGAASSSIIWGAQAEVGSSPTSYIPTTATSITRSAGTSYQDVNAKTLFDLGTLVASGNTSIGTTTGYTRLEVWGPDTASTTAFAVVNNASTTEFAVYDTGNAVLAGSLIQNSDQRLKTNITGLDASSSLAAINALNPVTFNWIDPAKRSVPQYGFIAQDLQRIFPNLVSVTAPTALTPDGTLSLNYIDLISPIVAAIQALSREIASVENTIAQFAQSITSAEGHFTNELCVGTTCVTPAQFQAMVATASAAQSAQPSSSPSSSSAATDTPPAIQPNGENPATVQVGATYNDLGATITGPNADLNLGIRTFLNGVLTGNIVLDTSAPATDTISYVVTDAVGLTSTSTRTVIVEPAIISPTALPPSQ